ncbi:glycosyltransferase [Escherichia coli]|nr:glycosyltransferase [Escherichia coli]EFN5011144.1 glycosyltransferase family 4 protein [Escherichia coli]EHW5495410.1 glycosyltransferase [Escherichia coli]MCN5685030.1 glycosyltransferase [Escherichia coli]
MDQQNINNFDSNRIKIVYVINTLDPGGAELGLEKLIKNNLFNEFDLNLIVIQKTNSALYSRLNDNLANKISYLTESKIKNIFIPLYAVKLSKLLQKIRPDIVISSLSQSTIITRLLKVLFNYKHISFEHNTNFQNKLAYQIISKTDSLSDFFWCDSIATQKFLLERGVEKIKSKIIPLFYIDHAITFFEKTFSPELKIISVGRLTKQKNYAYTLSVLKKLVDKGVNASLDIYGVGELKAELKILSNELMIANRVNFKGFVSDWKEDAENADIYMLSSDFEGLSIATLEAMSIGMLCVVRPTGEVKNYLTNNSTGIIASNEDEACDKIMTILNDNSLYNSIRYNAYNFVWDNFSINEYLNAISEAKLELEALYDNT